MNEISEHLMALIQSQQSNHPNDVQLFSLNPSFQCLPPASYSLYLALTSALHLQEQEAMLFLQNLQSQIITTRALLRPPSCMNRISWAENDPEGSAYLAPVKYYATCFVPVRLDCWLYLKHRRPNVLGYPWYRIHWFGQEHSTLPLQLFLTNNFNISG